jgi:hypothetical protein
MLFSMMKEEFIPIAYTISNVVAMIMLGCSWKYPKYSRIIYFLLFSWAAFTNAQTALAHPEYYMDYSRYVVLDLYRNFIRGFFGEHVTMIVIVIAACQLTIGISILLRGWIFRTGCIGGILFLVSIAPFGVGSAFPCTLIMAAGLLLLLRKKDIDFIWNELHSKKVTEESTEVL